MVEIRIDNTNSTNWLYGSNHAWKDYCGCNNFDEEVVLTGNRNFTYCTEAEWYQKAKEVLTDIACYDEYPEDVSHEVNAKLKALYDNCRYTDDILLDVIRLLYPDNTFSQGTIHGYSQGDWQNYIVMGNVDIELLETMYFGKISDITITNYEEQYGDIITHDELWKVEREGDLKAYFRKRYDIAENEEIRIYQADGYKQILDWKEVG